MEVENEYQNIVESANFEFERFQDQQKELVYCAPGCNRRRQLEIKVIEQIKNGLNKVKVKKMRSESGYFIEKVSNLSSTQMKFLYE